MKANDELFRGVSSDYLRARDIRHVDRDEATELLGFPVSCGGIWIPWSSTANGLESQAVIRSSIMIALDESHLADPKTLDNGVYLLANGVAKAG